MAVPLKTTRRTERRPRVRRPIRALLLIGSALAFVSVDAAGQVELSGRLENNVVLLFEPVVVNLRIRNRTSEPITVGPRGDMMPVFYVERRPGYPLRKTGVQVEIPEITLQPHEQSTMSVDISLAFEIRETGPYTIHAGMRHGPDYYQTGHMLLEVVPGFEVARLEVGLPGGVRERREYRLLSLGRDNAMRLFIRVDDQQEGLCYGVHDLGRLLQNSEPILEADAAGRAHVLHRSGPAQFTHTIHEPNGRQVGKTLYSSGVRVARLEPTPDGDLEVRGVREDEGNRAGNRPSIRTFDPFQ